MDGGVNRQRLTAEKECYSTKSPRMDML
uniref:Uncharacterized protein n=1 Tax=Glossina pallidipes TaxID=7398 RepID=A0A1B0AKA1_GLOPL